MKKIILPMILLTSLFNARANYLDENLQKLNWNGIEVVWLQDNTLPVYDFSIYFKEGALGDSKNKFGQTQLMFDLLSSGTNKFSQNQVLEKLEFYGSSFDSNITHEYSSISVSGLVKDLRPTLQMMCHLFKNANYPEKKLISYKNRLKTSMKNMVTSHSALANHIFRFESLRGTGYENPVKGTLASIDKIDRQDLVQRLGHFNKKVTKRIYIKGPADVLKVKDVITNNCGWKKTDYQLALNKTLKVKPHQEVLFVSIEKANQAQIRIGRTLSFDEVQNDNHELKSFTSNFMGGGFTSRLVQELRVKRGLTYSAGSYVSDQKTYGRAGISTFTKNNSIVQMLSSIKKVIKDSSESVSTSHFEMSKRNIKGNYLLSLESSSDFLQNLQFFDHVGRDYSEIYNFTKNIDKITKENLLKSVRDLFGYENQVKLVLGNKSLIKPLRKAGFKLKVIEYKDYL